MVSASGCEADIAAVAFDDGAARHVDPLWMERLVCGVHTWSTGDEKSRASSMTRRRSRW